MAEKFGTKLLFTAAMSICSVLTLLTPILAPYGPTVMCVLRMLNGAVQVKYEHPEEKPKWWNFPVPTNFLYVFQGDFLSVCYGVYLEMGTSCGERKFSHFCLQW